ncbi:MAG: PD-(D/E)XK nuclease family protein [Polyangiaceae bacterium]
MRAVVFESPSGEARQRRAAAWLDERRDKPVTIVGASVAAATATSRRALSTRGSTLGWRRLSLPLLAATLARPELVTAGRVPASGLALEAVCARIVHERGASLGRLEPLADRPGLPRALARSLGELRQAYASPEDAGALGPLLAAYESALDALGLADGAFVYATASRVVREGRVGFDADALLFFDAPLVTRAERELFEALAAAASDVLATVPRGDERTRAALTSALGVEPTTEPAREETSLERLQAGLFERQGDAVEPRGADASIRIISAPGESREAVEIARLVHAAAREGTPLDKIGVLIRTRAYGPHMEEAFRRANVPMFQASGARLPDPSGRALLALIACAAEGLSASRFAEYLSLGELPGEDDDGAPPSASPRSERFVPPDEEVASALLGAPGDEPEDGDGPARAPIDEHQAVADGTLRAPRHWERLIVDASVIGGADRWARRLGGLKASLAEDVAAYRRKDESHLAEAAARDLSLLVALERFALPLVRDLDALPEVGTWGAWVEALTALATRAIRAPARVLSVLAELGPMADVPGVSIGEVRMVLEARLTQLAPRTPEPRPGHVFVGTIEEARGLVFDLVFVPGLAEKMFPQKVAEDPLLLDRARRDLDLALPTNAERAADERLALRLAAGTARQGLVLSYPRLDVENARPRTPSFYGLEVLRVAEGALPGFEDLARRADRGANARVGWPAPERPADAIDDAEHDLALLEALLPLPERDQHTGAAHYLLGANEHLARALRFRGRRWLRKWTPCDGLVEPHQEARDALAAHQLDARSFSPTALQHFAACPYRFVLSAIHKLAPREEPAPLEILDPLTRGSMVHEIHYELLSLLRERDLLPVTAQTLEPARDALDGVIARVGDAYRERLAPAIDRVWEDALTGIAADLREWLRRMTLEPEWVPAHFELSFGLKDRRAEDPKSSDEPAELPIGLRLRGSIDLIERHTDGSLRATDYKTGKKRAKQDETLIGGGETLQPVLYAMTLEALFPGTRVVGGRLYYCTSVAGFETVDIPLDGAARAAAKSVADTVRAALAEGFLPAAPKEGACTYCDFRPVCGPYEETRLKRKVKDRLGPLAALRRLP